MSKTAPWYEFRAQGTDRAELWIYGVIGGGWFGDGLTAKNFVPELNALQVSQIDLHIHSLGGSVFDGHAIYTALRRHPANVTSYIDSVAASIASVVALAGDELVMPLNAMMMIHNPLGICDGFASDMRAMADVLDKLKGTLLNVYEERSTKTRDELSEAMDAETWLNAADAIEYGFIAEAAPELRVAAQCDPSQYAEILSHYRHMPPDLAAQLAATITDTAGGDAEDPPASPAEGGLRARGEVLLSSRGRCVILKPKEA